MFYKHKLSAKKNCVSKKYLCAIILKKGNDMGKIIVVEGTDCSGKETQTKRLVQNLLDMGIKAIRMAFPMYDTPTGKIIGGAFLGKEQFDIKPVFEETSVNVPAKVASLFYAADRCYNKDKIQKYLDDGYHHQDQIVRVMFFQSKTFKIQKFKPIKKMICKTLCKMLLLKIKQMI